MSSDRQPVQTLDGRLYRYARWFAVLFHLAHVLSLPLVMSYDSFLYVRLAEILGTPQFATKWDYLRTPLFPCFLKVAFWLLGRQALAAIVVSSLLGFAGVWMLSAAIRRMGHPRVAAAVLVLLSLYPLLIGYEHSLLSETGTFFFLAALLSLLIWETPHRLWKTTALAGAIIAGYYFRPTLLYMAPLAALLHGASFLSEDGKAGWASLRRAGRQRWQRAALHAAALVLVPFLAAHPWSAKVDQTGRKGDVYLCGMLRQVLLDPADLPSGPVRDRYAEAIHDAMPNGHLLLTGIDSSRVSDLAARLQTGLSMSAEALFWRQVKTHPLRYAKGVMRTMLVFCGLPGGESENRYFRDTVLTATESGSKLYPGPPGLDERLRPEFIRKTGRPVLAPILRLLSPVYAVLIFLGWLATLGIFLAGLVRLDLRMLALGGLPLAFCLMHALVLMSVDRYAFPSYPLVLLNLCILAARLFKHWTSPVAPAPVSNSDEAAVAMPACPQAQAKVVSRHEHLYAAMLLLALLVVFHRQVVFLGKTFLMENYCVAGVMGLGAGPWGYPGNETYTRRPAVDGGAQAWVIEPSDFFVRQALRDGELPLWNPHTGLGMEFVASGQAALFDPIQALFAFFPQRWWMLGVDVQVLLRLFLAGFFTYLFIRELRLSFWPAVAAGALYMLNNYTVDYGYHCQMRVDALLPLLLYGYQRLLCRPGTASNLIAVAAVAWTILADFQEATFMVLSLATLWYFWQVAWQVQGAAPGQRWGAFKSPTGRYLLVTAFGFALSAPLLLPLFENISLSIVPPRHLPDAAKVAEHTWPAGFASLLLVPYNNVPWAKDIRLFTCPHAPHFYVLVTLVMVLGLMSIRALRLHRPASCFFVLYFLVFLLCSFGMKPFGFLMELPVYGRVIVAKYVFPQLEFCLAAAAAVGLEYVRELGLSVWRMLLAIGIVLVAVVEVLFWIGLPSFVEARVFVPQLCWAAGLAGCLLGAVWLSRLFRLNAPRTTAIMCVLVMLEPLVWHCDLTFPTRYDPYTQPPYIDYLRKEEQPYRIFGYHGLLHPNISMVFGLDDVRGLIAFTPTRYARLYQVMLPPGCHTGFFRGLEPGISFNKYFELLNVRYVILPVGAQIAELGPDQTTSRFEPVYKGEVNIYRNNRACPRAFVVYSVESAGDMEDALRRMQRPDFDPHTTAVVEGPLPPGSRELLAAGPARAASPATVVSRTRNVLRIRATAEQPGILVVSEAFFPGWSARLDGREAPILATDVALRGVYLEAGTHDIEFVYRPWSFTAGVCVAVAALLCLAAWTAIRHLKHAGGSSALALGSNRDEAALALPARTRAEEEIAASHDHNRRAWVWCAGVLCAVAACHVAYLCLSRGVPIADEAHYLIAASPARAVSTVVSDTAGNLIGNGRFELWPAAALTAVYRVGPYFIADDFYGDQLGYGVNAEIWSKATITNLPGVSSACQIRQYRDTEFAGGTSRLVTHLPESIVRQLAGANARLSFKFLIPADCTWSSPWCYGIRFDDTEIPPSAAIEDHAFELVPQVPFASPGSSYGTWHEAGVVFAVPARARSLALFWICGGNQTNGAVIQFTDVSLVKAP